MTRLPRVYPGTLWLGLLAFVALSACASHEVNHLIGKNPVQVFRPEFMVDQSTMQFDESKPGVDWGMSLEWQGDHYILSVDQNTTPNQPTQIWQIVAIQDIPLLKQGQMFAMGSCKHNGKHDSRVVAVVDYDVDKQWFDRIEADWVYDYKQDAFISYPTVNIQCFNARYGLDLDKPRPAPAASTLPAAAATTRSQP